MYNSATGEVNPWFVIDLGQNHAVRLIKLINRVDVHVSDRFLEVAVSCNAVFVITSLPIKFSVGKLINNVTYSRLKGSEFRSSENSRKLFEYSQAVSNVK